MTQKSPSLFDWNIVGPAIGDSFSKLNPRLMIKNPVMFVTMVGAALTTVGIFTADRPSAASSRNSRSGSGSRCCSPISPKPSPKAAAKRRPTRLRKARKDTIARRLRNGREEKVPATELQKGDIVVCEADDVIPADGDVIEGIASVDEAAITGESAPVIRESGGDRSAVTGGTRVLSDRIVIRVTMDKGHGFLDRMIALVEGATTPEDAERNRADDFARGADVHFPAGLRDAETVRHLFRRGVFRARAHRAAGLSDSDDHRRTAERHRHRGHGPRSPAQRDGDERTRRRSRRRRGRAAARQDRHDHAGQPHGHGVSARAGHQAGTPGRCRATRVARRRDAGRPQHRGAGEGEVQSARPRSRRSRTRSSCRSPRRRA